MSSHSTVGSPGLKYACLKDPDLAACDPWPLAELAPYDHMWPRVVVQHRAAAIGERALGDADANMAQRREWRRPLFWATASRQHRHNEKSPHAPAHTTGAARPSTGQEFTPWT